MVSHVILKTLHFTTDEYAGLLHTDSLILTLSPPEREGFPRHETSPCPEGHFVWTVGRRGFSRQDAMFPDESPEVDMLGQTGPCTMAFNSLV